MLYDNTNHFISPNLFSLLNPLLYTKKKTKQIDKFQSSDRLQNTLA